jgi:hypothetical protein
MDLVLYFLKVNDFIDQTIVHDNKFELEIWCNKFVLYCNEKILNIINKDFVVNISLNSGFINITFTQDNKILLQYPKDLIKFFKYKNYEFTNIDNKLQITRDKQQVFSITNSKIILYPPISEKILYENNFLFSLLINNKHKDNDLFININLSSTFSKEDKFTNLTLDKYYFYDKQLINTMETLFKKIQDAKNLSYRLEIIPKDTMSIFVYQKINEEGYIKFIDRELPYDKGIYTSKDDYYDGYIYYPAKHCYIDLLSAVLVLEYAKFPLK